MKTFITNGEGSQQTITNVQDEKVPIYASVAAAEADLANLQEGQIIATPTKTIPTDEFATVPVGTVTGYQGSSAPVDNQWLVCDGSDTTGTNKQLSTYYPSLFTMLGGSNVLPEIFDHRKLSEWEVYDVVNNATMPYDGILNIWLSGSNNKYVTVNGVQVTDSPSTNTALTYEVNVKKGDVVMTYGTVDGCKAAFYKKHCIIKATANTDNYVVPSSEITQIESYIDEGIAEVKEAGLSYNTTETKTGGTWIDGKPIYRKVIGPTTSATSNTWTYQKFTALVSGYTDIQNVGIFVSARICGTNGSEAAPADITSDNEMRIACGKIHAAGSIIIIEYTKTTD